MISRQIKKYKLHKFAIIFTIISITSIIENKTIDNNTI